MRLQDDMGTEHVFILDNCLYHPDLPVNLLSMRCLAEKFIDESGNSDKETCIEYQYLTYVLTWSFYTFKSFYQCTVMTNTTTNSSIIPYDDKELIAFEDSDDAINMLFKLCESILLKDAKGTTSEVTYLGSQLLDEILLQKGRNNN